MFLHDLFLSLKRLGNKVWVSPVPAAAVIRADQVVSVNIGLKALVAGFVSLL